LRFGRLLVIEYARTSEHRCIIWRCLCDCGNYTEVAAGNLIQNKTTSCGCYKNECVSKRSVKDLLGERFGRLTVLERVGSDKHNKAVWKCICDCGNIKNVVSIALISGNTQSCGCYNKDRVTETHVDDLISKKYGRWIVVKQAGRNDQGNVLWECLCDCGNIGIVTSSSLNSGNSKSCGCLRRDVTIERNHTNHPMNDPLVRAKVTGINNPMYGRTGELNPAWKGGLSYEPYGPEWNECLREFIRDIFNRKCHLCDMSEPDNINKLDVHHINYIKTDMREQNLMALCHGCHLKTSVNRYHYYHMLVNYWTANYLDGITNI
jgi:hypothetical protein